MPKKGGDNKVKLLDYWVPPMEAGSPIGCLSTTFTFNSEFFEEECLTRFLQIESEPKEDGIVYLIEREEKLNQVECVSVWIDQSSAKQKRNLRWDLVPVRLKSGILHAKVSILYWSNYLRLIVGSANLTENGYRKNLETVATIDITESSSFDHKTAAVLLEYLTDLINAEQTVDAAVRNRSLKFIHGCLRFVKGHAEVSPSLRRNEQISFPILIKPNGKSFYEQISSIWENYTQGGPPFICDVTSPFFDPPSWKNMPAEELWKIMRKRGMAEVSFHTTGELDADDNPVRINAPDSINLATPSGRPEVCTNWHIVDHKNPEDEEAMRSLHIKNYWFENDSGWILFVVGSSNFTTKGLGLIRNSNFEANLAVLTHRYRFPKMFKRIHNSKITGEYVENVENVKWEPEISEEIVSSSETFASLPPFFMSATLVKDEKLKIEFRFSGSDAPEEFKICDTEGNIFYDHSKWLAENSPEIASVSAEYPENLSYFEISWKGTNISAFLPINISGQNCLPPPERLKNLPLDVLAMLITSARPMHEVLRTYSARNTESSSDSPVIDPLKKYDNSTFLLQRTRKFSFALNRIQERFEGPIPTEASLNWRLSGPVGLSAVVDAIMRESQQNRNETVFFLSELWKQLERVNPGHHKGCLARRIILNAIENFREDLTVRIQELWNEADNKQILEYSGKILSSIE